MNSLILRIATRYLLPLLLLYSVFLLMRGHDELGGGFAAALIAAVGLGLYMLGCDLKSVRQLLRVTPIRLMGLGLFTAAGSGVWGLLAGDRFLGGQWLWGQVYLLGEHHLGTPILFDVGVLLTAAGAVLQVIFVMEEEMT